MLRRGSRPSDRRRERREVHRLDGARRSDRGTHAHAEPPRLSPRGARARDAPRPRDLRARPALHRARVARRRARGIDLASTVPSVGGIETILEPDELKRYADAIVKASLGVARGDFLFVQGHPEHREVVVATAAAGYRAGATNVDVVYYDPLAERAHYEFGSKESLGQVSPWALRRMRELVKPSGARAVITGEADHGYLDGIDPKRIAADTAGVAAETKFYRRANLDLNARWTGAAWPTDYWASQVYPELSRLAGKRKLAQDFLWFCRLTDEDGSGARGWLDHVKAIARRSPKLTRLRLVPPELRGPGPQLDVKLPPRPRGARGQEQDAPGG